MSQTPNGTTEATNRVKKPARSKNGCMTCLRRKVRCNEQRPRCGHCERLNLQCAWRANNGELSRRTTTSTATPQTQVLPAPSTTNTFFDTFDFNDSIWHDTSTLDPATFEWPFGVDASDFATTTEGSTLARITTLDDGNTSARAAPASSPLMTGGYNNVSPASSADTGGQALVEHFLASVVPPILSSVEVGPRWTSTKMLLASLAESSSMVRHAMMAFSALEYSGGDNNVRTDHRTLYDKASRAYNVHVANAMKEPGKSGGDLVYGLATAFFLAYSDLITNRVRDAQTVLRDAASLLASHRGKHLSTAEKRLIAWIRLIDSKAASAGTDGSFLAESDRPDFTPSTAQNPTPKEGEAGESADRGDTAIEDILFDVLYAPGLAFYQKVQSIMARVSNIDPWHRTRGTVADETEVMAVAAQISADLRTLEAHRPALMDHAVAGFLTERHIAQDIAVAITRSYRVYWANYHAGHIHLHRVAYKHLPATPEVMDARSTIKHITHLLQQAGEQLPVNFIWPLLMACCEEDGLEERQWMIQAIRNMQSQASNAKPIADVLEEVHRRQDTTKSRADVRQVSLDLFQMSFAVV